MVVGYEFNLQTNQLIPRKVPNPGAGREHVFTAWRLKGSNTTPVAIRDIGAATSESDSDSEKADD